MGSFFFVETAGFLLSLFSCCGGCTPNPLLRLLTNLVLSLTIVILIAAEPLYICCTLSAMNAVLKIVVSLLLALNGIGALFGGWLLIMHPDGSGLHMPLTMLRHSPFNDFFIPGMILFTVNGLTSICVLLFLIFRVRKYAWLTMIQGALLTGWIVIQIVMIRGVSYLHLIYGGAGILLILCGRALQKINSWV